MPVERIEAAVVGLALLGHLARHVDVHLAPTRIELAHPLVDDALGLLEAGHEPLAEIGADPQTPERGLHPLRLRRARVPVDGADPILLAAFVERAVDDHDGGAQVIEAAVEKGVVVLCERGARHAATAVAAVLGLIAARQRGDLLAHVLIGAARIDEVAAPLLLARAHAELVVPIGVPQVRAFGAVVGAGLGRARGVPPTVQPDHATRRGPHHEKKQHEGGPKRRQSHGRGRIRRGISPSSPQPYRSVARPVPPPAAP